MLSVGNFYALESSLVGTVLVGLRPKASLASQLPKPLHLFHLPWVVNADIGSARVSLDEIVDGNRPINACRHVLIRATDPHHLVALSEPQAPLAYGRPDPGLPIETCQRVSTPAPVVT